MISVVIPTLNAAKLLPSLVGSIRRQTLIDLELIVVDSESEDGTAPTAESLGCLVIPISRRAFDHGTARNLATQSARGELLVFLTQDARPISDTFLEDLARPIISGAAAAAYARQLPAPDASPTEAFARFYNYPAESAFRHISTIRARTLRAFFFSNVASAISRVCFDAVGGFPAPIRTNEDMLLCARLLDAGYTVAYVAEAAVIHSHSLSLPELFRRYFRIGAVLKEHSDTLRSVRDAREGYEFVRRQVTYLGSIGRRDFIPRAFAEAGVKTVAYHCGRALARDAAGR